MSVTHNGDVRFVDAGLVELASAPATKTGVTSIYSLTDGRLYFKDSGGVQHRLIVEDLDVTLTGSLKVGGQMWNSIPTTMLPTGTTQEVDWANGNAQILDLESATGDVTVTFVNAEVGASFVLEVHQDSTVARDIIWPGSVKWPDGVTPTVSASNDAIDIFTFFYSGSTFKGNVGQDYQ